jgi:hypothetical protein
MSDMNPQRFRKYAQGLADRSKELAKEGNAAGYQEVMDDLADFHDTVLNCREHYKTALWCQTMVRELDAGFYERWKQSSPKLANKKGAPWTEEEDALMRKHNDAMSERELAAFLGRTVSSVANRRVRLGLKRPPGANAGFFKKGERAYICPKGRRLSPATEFKKGQKPLNTKRYGFISVRNNKNTPYYWIHIAEKQWVPLHRYVYEKEFGAIPKGYIVTFRDKDWQHCLPENLELITLAENVRRNQNREKASASIRAFYQTDEGKALRIAGQRKDLAGWILKHHPELLSLADLTTELRKLALKTV